MVFLSFHPGHSRRSVVNVDKFSGTNFRVPTPVSSELIQALWKGPSQLSRFDPGICPSTARHCPHLLARASGPVPRRIPNSTPKL